MGKQIIQSANVGRLRAILAFLETEQLKPGQINMATYMATPRQDQERAPVGCVLGHYARAGESALISLVPITFWAQVKSPLMADALEDEFPPDSWQHWTLRYSTQHIEAYGLTAACAYLQLGQWDCQRLFFPAGTSYEVRPPIKSLVFRIGQLVRTTHDPVGRGDGAEVDMDD